MNNKSQILAGGHQLAYKFINKEEITQEKPILVFLHEGLGCIDKWKEFPENLSSDVNLPALVYERYGYGNSESLKEPRTSDFLHNEAFNVLPEILKKLNIHQQLILIGHSDGGSISLLYASKFPNRVKGLLLEAPHVLIEELSAQGLKSAILAYQYSDLKERLLKYHGENTDSMFWGWANIWSDEKSSNWNIEGYLPKINSPVLFIQGEDDQYGSLEQLKAIEKGVSGEVEPVIISECGHIPHHEKEEEVLKIMSDYIRKLLSR